MNDCAVLNRALKRYFWEFLFRNLSVIPGNDLPVSVMEQVIESMSYNKLNVLHWHIVFLTLALRLHVFVVNNDISIIECPKGSIFA